jgi:hypothetical protein
VEVIRWKLEYNTTNLGNFYMFIIWLGYWFACIKRNRDDKGV